MSPDKRWVRIEPAGGKSDRFAPSPGKHTIRVAYPLQGVTPRIRPVSGPVEIEVREDGAK